MKRFRPLLCDRDGNISLGRVSFWLVFLLACYFWLYRLPEDFPPTLDTTLAALMAYNVGSKMVRAWIARSPAPTGGSHE